MTSGRTALFPSEKRPWVQFQVPLCEECACAPHVRVGSLWVLSLNTCSQINAKLTLFWHLHDVIIAYTWFPFIINQFFLSNFKLLSGFCLDCLTASNNMYSTVLWVIYSTVPHTHDSPQYFVFHSESNNTAWMSHESSPSRIQPIASCKTHCGFTTAKQKALQYHRCILGPVVYNGGAGGVGAAPKLETTVATYLGSVVVRAQVIIDLSCFNALFLLVLVRLPSIEFIWNRHYRASGLSRLLVNEVTLVLTQISSDKEKTLIIAWAQYVDGSGLKMYAMCYTSTGEGCYYRKLWNSKLTHPGSNEKDFLMDSFSFGICFCLFARVFVQYHSLWLKPYILLHDCVCRNAVVEQCVQTHAELGLTTASTPDVF